jgi:nitronate monooxygenase
MTAKLLDLLGVDLPIIQAPMAGVQDARLALAVGATGALGSVPSATLDATGFRAEVERVRAMPSVNFNFFCHTTPAPDPARDAAWRARLAPYYAELGISPPAGGGPGRTPFSAELAEVVAAAAPRVVSFHFGLPAPELLARVKAAGCKVLASATTVAEGRWLAARGVDAVIAQGIEAGGHRGHFLRDDLAGQPPTFELVRQIVAAVPVPVIAAGGIADAAGVATALHLGAAAVQCGSAYLLCPEATTSAVHRAALRSEAACGTAITNLFSGRPARGIVNRLMQELGAMRDDVPRFPLASVAIAPLRAAAEKCARGDFSPLWAGTHRGRGCDLSARDVTQRLWTSLG